MTSHNRRLARSPHKTGLKREMVVLLQVARTPEPAVASTHCIESFDLTEVQDKLEGKEKNKKTVGFTIQQVHATKRRMTAQVQGEKCGRAGEK